MPDHQFVDVHAHISDPDFDKDRAEVLVRACKAVVENTQRLYGKISMSM